MGTRRALVLLLALLGLACGNKPAARVPGAPPPDAAKAAGDYRCASADDCALSNHRSETDCCGDPCASGQPYHERQLAALKTALAARCKPGTFECPVADCDLPPNFVPGCVAGACTAIELSRRTECARDDECTLACKTPGECCASCECEQPWHKDDLARADAWRAAQCAAADCPMFKCVAPAKVARCRKGWCVAE